MWTRIAAILIRQRLAMLLLLGIGTVFMGLQVPKLQLQYEFGGLLPKTDSTAIAYERFKEIFGAEGNVMLIGSELDPLKSPEGLLAWDALAQSIRNMDVRRDTTDDGRDNPVPVAMVDSVFCFTLASDVVKDTTDRRFVIRPLLASPRLKNELSQAETDAFFARLFDLPFYEGLLYNKERTATLMTVFMNPELFNSERRGTIVEDVTALTDAWGEEHGVNLALSGLPFIRIQMTNKVKDEIGYFIGAAFLVTALLLFLFFRNPVVMGVSMVVVSIGVVCSLGSMALLDYRLSLMTSLIPPLMIVIGVPNCIYLVNKYHGEYKRHGNKAMALQRMIVKVGNATLLTNFTTALGFATFIFTRSDVLKEFGVVTAVNIMGMFVISIVVIPALMTWLPAPKSRHTEHLDRRWMFSFVNRLAHIVQNHRPKVYVGSAMVLLFSLTGLLQIQTTGNIVDDLPDQDRVIQDLKWIEARFGGSMPFEVMVDTGKPNGATSNASMKRIEKLQDVLREYPEFSRSVSAADATKFAFQAFKNGHPKNYRLPRLGMEKTQFGPWLRGSADAAEGSSVAQVVTSNFFDSTRAITRVSVQMADVGTQEMRSLLNDIEPRIDSIFPPSSYDLTMTGTSVAYLKGTTYMVQNLGISIVLAICVIAMMMAMLFKSARMVAIALVPNLFPLLFTAGFMGWLGIPIKPSTVLVFSIAFGISVDDTIHFLAKYRQELNTKGWNISEAVLLALKETGVSMMYTSIVLFFGFLMFALSTFEGTRFLGVLVSITLGVAMTTNLLLLPSLLLQFEKTLTTKSFKEPFFSILDEEEDIELEELEIQQGLSPGKGEERHDGLVNKRASAPSKKQS